MKIAFFSTWHGRGTTTNAIVTAVNLAVNYNAKVLLTHSQYTRSSMEDAFIKNKSKDDNILDFNDTGIDSIERLVKSRQLSKEDFPDYTLSFIENRLDLLIGSKKSNVNLFSEDINRTILDILNKADGAYDFTIIDVNSGENSITKKIVNDCDLIIYNIEQNEKIIKDFFERDIKKLDKDKLLILLSRYDENIKCSAKYINNNFKWKDEVYKISYSSKLMDYINNHAILKFFYTNKNDQFFRDLNLLSKRIVDFKKDGNVVKSQFEFKQSILNLKNLKSLFRFS